MHFLDVARKLIDLVPSDDCEKYIIDGGCHTGQFTNEIIKQFPESNILAFEPDSNSYKLAKANTKFYKKIDIVNSALGCASGRAEFFRGEMSATNSLLSRPDDVSEPYYPKQATLLGGNKVDIVSIDEECEKRGVKKIDLLKLDLQGFELMALKGASSLLEKGSIKIIIIEAVFIQKYKNQPLLWETWGFLARYDYTLYSLEDIKVGLYDSTDVSLRQGQWNQCDVIFISKEYRRILDATNV